MGRHGLETRAVWGAGLHNSLAAEREKQHRCPVSERPWGDGGPPGQQGTGATPCIAPYMACVLLGQEGRGAPHVPSLSPHSTGSRRRPAATRVTHCPSRDCQPIFRPPGRPQARPCPAAPLGGARAPRPPWRAGLPLSLRVYLPQPGGAAGNEPGGNVLKRTPPIPGVPHSSGCFAGAFGEIRWQRRARLPAAVQSTASLALNPVLVRSLSSLPWLRKPRVCCHCCARLLAWMRSRQSPLWENKAGARGQELKEKRGWLGSSYRTESLIAIVIGEKVQEIQIEKEKTTPCILYLYQRQTNMYLRTS